MFYRRKIILSLLQAFNWEIEKIKLQKLIFLASERQKESEYQFVPYKFGCYSFSLKADLVTMVKKGLIDETPTSYKLASKVDYFKSLKEEDKVIVRDIKKHYSAMSSNSLMKYTYVHYPYLATKSTVAHELLNEAELARVNAANKEKDNTTLYTIGYEGISLEDYFNKLIKHDIKVLVDVRSNALSMKFGFSKTLLSRYCGSLGIAYKHFPEVGIKSNQRQELNTQSDYDKLFKDYKKELPSTLSTQITILELLKQEKRIALTCFEADICQCHRKPLAESIKALPNFKYELKHI
ncbi:MAG: DUF488 domain-containing protein [Pedobacter sp.]|nr:MAG: DUF488 domain-containing protein [Pedobacter sp.]